MADRTFSSLGLVEAVKQLYEGTSYRSVIQERFEAGAKDFICNSSALLTEGVDFDLVYFPLKHLGYKSVIAVTGELYAQLAAPSSLRVNLGVSSKLDYPQIKELFDGVCTAAREHGYKSVSLELSPCRNGLCIAVSACGLLKKLTSVRRMQPKSMDLLCISGNLGAAFLGLRLLEREKEKFVKTGRDSSAKTLEGYKMLVGAYLKPELAPSIIRNMEEDDIIPSVGYFVRKGLADTLKRIVTDTGLGVKVYVDKIPFAGRTFELGKEFDFDPVSAAMNGGEDCRLLFTIPISEAGKFRRDFQTFDIIGHLAKSDVGAVLVTPDGLEHKVTAQGWKE